MSEVLSLPIDSFVVAGIKLFGGADQKAGLGWLEI